jgi:hypothetical protein
MCGECYFETGNLKLETRNGTKTWETKRCEGSGVFLSANNILRSLRFLLFKTCPVSILEAGRKMGAEKWGGGVIFLPYLFLPFLVLVLENERGLLVIRHQSFCLSSFLVPR